MKYQRKTPRMRFTVSCECGWRDQAHAQRIIALRIRAHRNDAHQARGEERKGMDPDACYQDLMTLLRGKYEQESWDTTDEMLAAELFTALDDWLARGGFLPSAWEKSKVRHWQEVLASTNARAADLALDAARRAVEATFTGWCKDYMNCTDYEHACGNRREIIAAIDALKEKP